MKGNVDQVFEKIDDAGTEPCSTTDIPLVGDILEAAALAYWPGEDVFLATGFEELSTITLGGLITAVGTLDHESTGIALVPDTDGDGTLDFVDGCPNDPGKIDPGACGCGVADADADVDGVPDCLDLCPGEDDSADGDDDGKPDCLDQCPEDPEKIHPGSCGCGVSDDDSDGDGVSDCLDACPDDAEKANPGACGCGRPDGDGHGDGVADCLDACPGDPDKTDPGACGCGVPDSDSDADGVPDCPDGCPEDPNKTNPGACGCGVPDTDADGDGVADCLDSCPDDPDKTNPESCGCGVPDTDADGDDTPDCRDNCPTIPNAAQGDLDGDGIGDACALLAAPLPCPENITLPANEPDGLRVDFALPGAGGDAGNLTVTADPPTGSLFPIGTTTVTITTTDAATGATNTCTFDVTVEEAPLSPLALLPFLFLCGLGLTSAVPMTLVGIAAMKTHRRRRQGAHAGQARQIRRLIL